MSDLGEEKRNVFSTPDFNDITLHRRKSEVIGWLNQKWHNREYSDFVPPLMPQAQMRLNDAATGPNLKYYMTEHCGVKSTIAGTLGYALGTVMGLFMYGGQADMAMASGQLQPEYKGMESIIFHLHPPPYKRTGDKLDRRQFFGVSLGHARIFLGFSIFIHF